jgi:hypothetical protein
MAVATRAPTSTAGGLGRITQNDFSGGMFPSLAPELIPANGAYDITNGLLDEESLLYRRGGTGYLTAALVNQSSVKMLWSGYLEHGGLTTVLGTGTGVYTVSAAGAFTQLAGIAGLTMFVRPTVFKGTLYIPVPGAGKTYNGETVGTATHPALYYASAGNRLLYAETAKPQLVESKFNAPTEYTENEYLEVPAGVQIIGLQGLRTSCVVFTTQGIWIAQNLTKLLTDANGNVQQALDLYSADLVLWGNAGVAGWSGGLVVPCRDDIWIMELGVSSEKAIPLAKISAPIVNVYRGYVQAGYQPGCACVYRGHYFLPVMNGDSLVDLLACKLAAVRGRGRQAQPEYAWTHLAGTGAKLSALAVKAATEGGAEEEHALLGGAAGEARVLKLNYFTPVTSGTDADGSNIAGQVTTRDIQTGNLVSNTVAKVRLSYRMSAPGGSGVKLAIGETAVTTQWDEFNWDEASWATSTGAFSELEGLAPPDSTGTHPYTFRTSKKVRYLRLRLELSGPATSFSLRMIEIAVRPSGRIW